MALIKLRVVDRDTHYSHKRSAIQCNESFGIAEQLNRLCLMKLTDTFTFCKCIYYADIVVIAGCVAATVDLF